MLVAQITDCHIRPPGKLIYGAVDTAAYLARAVAALNALDPRPDIVIVTGDLVDAGAPDEYARLRELLSPLVMPWRLLAGNHDDRENLRAAFPDHNYLRGDGGFVQYALEDGPLRLLSLDSLDVGAARGKLCADRLAWLDRTLSAAPERPTMIFVHHPPFASGVEKLDGDPFYGAREFAAIVARHPQVERVAAGHLHRATTLRWGGTVASTCPSTAHQFALDLRAGAPLTYVLEPPAYQLHLWRADQGVLTHTVPLGDFPPPRPLR
ncbi:MAG: phosphodiesterase [Rhodospirillales bacterium]|nr:phosphodiesterase [Rhodospirillales bacterium]